jgi:hypothetical protein
MEQPLPLRAKEKLKGLRQQSAIKRKGQRVDSKLSMQMTKAKKCQQWC